MMPTTRAALKPANRKVFRIHLRRKHLYALLAFAAIILLKVWQKTNVDSMNRRNGRLAEDLKAVRYENLMVEARVEELSSMERITRIAKDELDMVEVPKIKLQEKNAFERLTAQFTAKPRTR